MKRDHMPMLLQGRAYVAQRDCNRCLELNPKLKASLNSRRTAQTGDDDQTIARDCS